MTHLRAYRRLISGLMVTLMAFWQIAQPLQAATLYWDGSASGSWNTVSNWSTIIGGGSNPAAVAGVNDDVIFNATTVGSQIATLDAAQSVRSLTFSSNATSPITLAAGTTGTLALGSGGITLQSGSAAVTISAPISLAANQTWTNDSTVGVLALSGALTEAVSGTTTLTFDGAGDITMGATSAASLDVNVIKNGTGTTTWTADPNIAAANTVTVNNGVLVFQTNTADFTTATINSGGTLRAQTGSNTLSDSLIITLNGTGIYDIRVSDTIGGLVSTSTSAVVTNGGASAATLTVSNATNRQFDGVLQNGAAALGFSKAGTNTVTLSNNSTYTGTTTVSNGRLVLSGADGRLSGSTTINVGDNNGAGDALQLGATGGADTISGTLDRIADGATITLSGGVLDLQGPSAASVGTTETITTLAIGATGDSVISLTAAAGGTVQLSATSMTRAANAGTALVRGTALGSTGADTARLVLATAPTGNNFIGTSTTAGDKNLRIIPWLVGDSTATGAGSGFVTHDATNGLRTLVAGEYGTAITGNANNNISNAGGETFSVAGSNFSVNSMLMTAGTTTVNGGSTSPQNYLTVASGALLFTGNATLAGTGRLNLGGIEGIILSAANTTAIAGVINNVITGTAGLTIGSAGDVSNTVALGGANLFTGGVRINSGVLRLDHGNALGGVRAMNAVTLNTAGTLSVNGQSAVIGSLTGVAGSVVNNGNTATAARLRIHQTADQNFTGTIVNGGAAALNIVKTGGSTLTLNAGNSTFTGALVILQGAMTLSGNAGRVSGATSLSIGGGGTLRLTNTTSTSNQADRLINGTAVTLRGGTFDYDNSAGTNTSYAETIGALTLSAGANSVIVDRATTGRTTLLTSASLARTQGAVVTFGSQSNGTTDNTLLGLNAQDRLLFTAIPTLNDGILGGWALGNGGTDFATYWNGGTAATRSVGYLGQATTLVTPAGSQLYSTDLSEASWTTSTNVFLSAAGATLTADRTVNSLKLASPRAVNLGGFTLNVDAGGILYAGGTAGTFTGISNGSLTTQGGATASPDLVFHLNNATDVITVSANIIDNGANAVGLTKSGGGTLILSGTNTYTGPTAVVGGTLNIDSDARLGTAPGSASAGHLKLYNGSTINTTAGFELNANRSIELGGGGTITLNATGNLIYNGTITSPIPTGSDIPDVTNLTLTGDIDMLLAGGTTIGGSWVISGGTGAESLITLAGTANYIGGGLVIGRGNNARAKVVYGGSGPLTVGSLDPTGFNIDIGHGNVAGTGTTMGELDLSGMTGTFTATVANLRIGFETITGHSLIQGILRLGSSSNITASTAVLVGNSPNQGAASANSINYGSGTHTLTTPLITLGGQKSTNAGTGLFLQSGANLTINGFGPAASELRIAYNNTNTGTIGTGTLDASLGILKGDFSTITVGFISGNSTGGANGDLLIGTDALNNISATTIIIGDQRQSGTGTTGNVADGLLTFGGGSLKVSQNLVIANHQGNNTAARGATGVVNLNGGTTEVSGNVIVANTAPAGGTGLHSTTGTLNLGGGDLAITGNLIIGNTLSNISVAHASNGTLNLSNASSNVTVGGDVQLGSVDSSVTNPIATGTLNLTNGTLTVNGNISRSLLNGAEANQSRGFINVAGGALNMTDGTILAKALAFRSGSIINVAAGGITLDAESTTSTTTIAGLTGDALILRDVNLTANVALTGTTASNVHYENAGAGAGGTLSGNLDLGTATRTFNIEDIVANAEDLTVSGIISNSGDFIKTGAGTLRLSGANTFTGSVTVSTGELKAGHNQGFGNANNAYSITSGAFLSVGGFSNTIGALTGTGAVQNGAAGAGTLVVGGGNASSSFAGTVQDGAGGGVLNVTKTGTGTVSLTNAANLTYTGTTTVNGGILNAGIRGSLGIAITGGTLNFADGTANTLTLGSSGNVLQLSSGAVLGFELGATGDKIVLASGGQGLSAGSITLDLYGIAGLAAGTYDLIAATTGGLLNTNGSTGAYILGNQPSGFTYDLIQSDTLVQVIVAAFTGKYWRGDVDGSWLTDNAGDTNFSSDAGGLTDAGAIPGAADSVLFSASTATGPVIATTLGADFTIKELIFLSQPAGVTDVTIAPGGAFALTITPTDGATQGITLNAGAGNVVITAPVVIGADQTWKVVNAVGTSLTVSGSLTGTNAVTKTNTGALTLSGDNSGYSGVLTLNGGILNLNSATALGTGNFAITAGTFDNTTGSALTLTTNNTQAWNGDFSFGGANNLTFGVGAITLGGNRTVTANGAGILAQQGNIGGAFSLTKEGVGVLALAGNASNYSGGSIVNAGTLSGVVTGASGTPLGSGDVTLNAGALALRGDGTGNSGTIAVGNNLIVAGSATVDVNRLTANTGNTFALGSLSIGASTLTVNSANSYGLSFTAGTLSGNATISHAAGAVTIGGVVGETGGARNLTKSGAGTLVLNGDNTFSGGVTQTAGTINLGHAAGLGTGLYNVTGASTLTPTATLSVGNAVTLDAGLTIAGTESLTLAGTITNSTTSQTLTNNLDLADTLTLTGTVNLSETNTARTLIISGTGNTVQSSTSVIQNGGTAAGILDKSGTGTLTLNGVNTFSDDLLLRQGTLILGHKNAAGSDRLQTVTTTGSVIQANTDLTGVNALPVQFLFNVANTIVSGTNSIQFTGTTTNNGGNRTLTNNMTGGATLTLGTVNLTESTTTGRTMTFSGTGTTIVGAIANVSSGASSLIKSGTGTLIVTGTSSMTGATTVNNGVLQIGNGGTTGVFNTTSGINLAATTAILRYDRSNAATGDRVISGSGSFEQAGAGTTTLTGANSYSGTTSISAGGLTIGNNGTAGTLGTGDVILSNSATLTFNRSDAQTIANNITGTGNLTKTSTGAVTLTPGTANTFAGTITVLNSSLIAGNASAFGNTGNNVVVTATGAGITATLDLNGNNYTTGTVAMGGTTATSSSTITTGAGTLTLGGDVTYSAATNPLGALITGNLDLGSATRVFDVGNSTSAATDLDLQTLLSGSGVGFTKTGDGTLSLGGGSANTYTGTTTVNGGLLILAKGPGLIVIGGNLAIGDGTGNDLVRLTSHDQIVSTSLVSFTGTGANAGILQLNGQNQTLGGLSSTGGAGIVENGAAGLSTLTIDVGSGTQDFSGILQNGASGTLALVKSGSGTQILSGENSFTDGATLNGGSLQVGSAGALGSSGTISFGGGALRFSSSNTTDYSARFSTAAAQPVKIDTNGQTVTFATALTSSTGTLEKSGLGNLILSAANTYTGATAVNAGKLFVNGSLDVASAVTVASGATLGGTGSISGAVTVNNGGILEAGHLGAGTLTIGTLNLGAAATDTSIINLSNIATGTPGILDLTALNVITDPNTITINISNAVAVATGTYKLIDYTGTALTTPQFSAFTIGTTTGFNSRQVLSLSNNTALTQIDLTMTGDAPKWTGALSSEWSAATLGTPKNWVLITGATETDFLSGDQVLFDDTASGSYVVDISNGNVDPASVEFNNSNGAGKTYTLQGSNGITGTTGLTKNNTGTLIINNANSFTGGVVLNNGVIQLGNANALGTGNLLTFGAAAPAGTELQLNGNNATVTGLVSVGSDAVVENGTSASTNATLTVNLASGSNTFAGVLQNGGTDTLALNQTGAGTLILTGMNTYTGGTTVGTGSTLQVGDGGAGGSIAGNATVNGALSFNRTGMDNAYGGTVGGTGSLSIVAGTLEFTGTVNNTLAGTSISSGATLQIGNGTTGGTVSSNIANEGTLVVSLPAAGSTILSGNITGAGALTTTGGNGTTILTGANTYTGATMIGTGTILQVGNGGTAGALGTGTVTVDGTLRFSRTDALTVSAPLGGAGGVNIASGSITYIEANTYAGATTVDSGATLSIGQGGVLGSVVGDIVTNGSVIFNRGDAITYAGVISGAGTMTKTGNGVTTFSGASTYSGSTTIDGGTLSISASNNLGDASATNTIAISNGAILQNTGAMVDLGSNRTVTIGTGGAVLDVTDANALTVSGVVSGSTLLTKTGTGTLTLSGANTHSAGTTLSAGTLNLNHATAIGSGTFTIAGGTTIDNTSAAAITLSNNNVQAWNGDFTFTGTKDLNLGTGGVTLSANRAVTVSGGTLTVGGIIDDGAGNVTFTKNGAGTLYLAGVNTFGSNTAVTIAGGVLKIDAESGLGTNTNDVTFTGTGTLQVTTGFSANTGKVFAFGTNTGTLQVDTGTLVIGSAVTAGTAGIFVKAGSGTVQLTVASTALDGTVRLDAGTLSLRGNSANVLGDTTSRVQLRFNGGNLSIEDDTARALNNATFLDASGTITLDRVIAGAGVTHTMSGAALTVENTNPTLTINAGANITSGTAGLTFGATTLNGNATFNITDPVAVGTTTLLTLGAITGGANSLTLQGNGDFAQSGVFAGTGASLVLDSGYTGTATLNQANTFTGGVTIRSGTVVQSTAAAGLGTGTLTLGHTSGSDNATLTATGTGFTSTNAITVAAGSSGTATIGGNNASNFIYSGAVTLNKNLLISSTSNGTLTLSGVISGTSGLTVNNLGSGATLLTNLNDYMGATVINGGILRSNTTITNFNGGAASWLGASSSAAANLVINGGTLFYDGATGGTTDRLFTLGTGGGGITNDAVSNGTLAFSNTGSIVASGTGDRTLTLTANGTGTFTFTPSIVDPTSGKTALAVVIPSTAIMLLNGSASNYSGNNTLTAAAAGVLRVGSTSGLGTGTWTLGTGSILDYQLITSATNATYTGNLVVGNNNVTLRVSNPTSNTGAATATIGGVTLGSGILTYARGINMSSNNTSSLATDTTTLTDSPTINLTAGSGSAAYLVSLGALNDGGVARTITITGAAAGTGDQFVRLFEASTVFTAGTNIVYNGGNVGGIRLDNATAFGTATNYGTITFSTPATSGGLQLRNNAATNFRTNFILGGNDLLVELGGTSGTQSTKSHTAGTLSIGTATLTLTGILSTASNSVHSLVLLGTTFTGNSTFNVANTNGTGIGSLTLGALDDGAVARTLTKTGNGILQLNTAATSIVGGTNLTTTASITQIGNATAFGSGTLNVGNGTTTGQLRIADTVTLSSNTIVTYLGGTATLGTGSITGPTTGTGTINSTININAAPGADTGHFQGGGGTLNITGPIVTGGTSGGEVIVRAGNVGLNNATGNSYTSLRVNEGTTSVGANNAILTGANVFLAELANANLNIGAGLSQTIASTATWTLGGTGPTLENNVGTIATGTGTLVLNGTIANNTGSLATQLVTGEVSFGGTSGTFNIDSGTATSDMTVSANLSNGSLVKDGAGILTLSGTKDLTNLTVNSGSVVGGYGNSGVDKIIIGGAGSVQLVNSVAETLTLAASAGALTLADGARIGFELGAGNIDPTLSFNDQLIIAAGGTAATVAGNVTLDFYNLGLSAGTHTYDLIKADSGLNLATYVVGNAPLGFNYTLSQSDTLVRLVTEAIIARYWTGDNGTSWATAGNTNWSSTPDGLTDPGAIPGSTETLIFSATNATGSAISTTLDGMFTIDALQFLAAPTGVTAVTIAAGSGGTLTLAPASTSAGIFVATNAGTATLEAGLPFTVGAAQTWNVTGGGANGSALVVAADTAFNANVTKSGAGALTLSGTNTGSATLNLSAGTLNLNTAAALGGTNFTINGGTTLDNSSASALTVSTTNAITLNGNFTFTGTQNLSFANNAVSLPTNVSITTTAGILTFNGVISESGGSRSLTKLGAGALTLGGNNAFAGGVNLNAGILNLNHSGALGTGTFTIAGGTLDNTSGFAITNANNNEQTWNGNFAFTGANNLNLGTGAVSLGSGAGTSRTVTVTAGILEVGGVISNGAVGTGITKLGNGTLVLSGANTYTGNTTVSAGTLSITGTQTGNGTTTSGSSFVLGGTAGTSVLNLSGDISNYFQFTGATVAGANAIYNQTAGTASFTSTSTTASSFLSNIASGFGALNITGGTTDILGRFILSRNGAATAYVGGTGTLNLKGEWGMIVYTSAGALGSLTIGPGGTVDRTGASNLFGIFMEQANQYGVFNIAGGTFITTNRAVVFGNGNGGNNNIGFLNLAGGTFTTGSNVTQSVGTSTGQNAYINLAGGTLKATATLSNAFPGTVTGQTVTVTNFGAINNIGTAQDFTGGLTVDTNGNSVTIQNPILAATGEGVAQSSLSVTGGSGYVGAPLVQFVGGTLAAGGTPAAGYAIISGGQVTEIVITSPGTYTTAPTVTLTGGGGAGASVAVGALVANTSGGLTKTGNGTLTLSAVNTYTGGTTINGGTLALGGATGTVLEDSGAVTINSGGTFDVNTRSETVGQVTLNDGSITGTTGVLTGSDYAVKKGSISAILGGTAGLTKTTSETVTLSGTNTFTGAVNVNGGALAFSTSGNLGDGTAATNTIGLGGGTLRYTGSSELVLGANRVVTLNTGTSTVEVTSATGTLTVSGGVSNASTGNLVKAGAGILEVSNNVAIDLNGGTVSVSDGVLRAGLTDVSTLTVSSTGTLELKDNAGAALTLGATAGALTLNGGSVLGFELGNATNFDSITVATGGTAVTNGTVTLNFFDLGGIVANTYNLIVADSGLNGATFVVGTAPPGFSYSISQTDSLVSLTTTAFVPRYWTGSESTTSWATVNGTGPFTSNWSSTADGLTNTGTTPSMAHTVIFSADAVSGAPTVITTTLDAAFTVDSLQFRASPAGVTAVNINNSVGSSLELKPAGTTGGIFVDDNAGVVTLGAGLPVTVTNSQTWGVVGTGVNGSALIVAADVIFNAAVNKTRDGTLTLSGSNSGTGAINLSAGRLNINSTTALGGGTFTIANLTTIDNTSGGAITLATNNQQNWNGTFTFAGTNDLNMGTGNVTLGAHVTITTTAGNLTVGGAIGDGASSYLLTKAGAGTLTLGGANTHDGGVRLDVGQLIINNASALGSGTFTINGGTIDNTSGSAIVSSQNNAQTWNAGFTFTGTNNLDLGSGTVTLGADVTVITAAGKLSVGAIADGASAFDLTKQGAGTLVVGGASTYAGGNTNIDDGILMIGVNNALPTATIVRIGTGATAGTLDLNGFNQTIGSLLVQTNSTTLTNNIEIDSGKTLTVNGAVTLGVNTNGSATRVTFSGGGSFVVNSGGGNFQVGGATTADFENAVTANFSGLLNFTADLGSGVIRVGDNNSGNPSSGSVSTLTLATNNTITAATFDIGNGAEQANDGFQVTLGSGANIINSDTINIGSAGANVRAGGRLIFDAGDSTGTLVVRSSTGGASRAVLNMINTSGSTGNDMVSTLNLAGHQADLRVSTLTMASRTQNAGAATATLSFDQGTLDVTALNMASRTGAASTGNANATLNLGDSAASGTPEVTIGTLTMAVNTSAGGTSTATLNVTGGTVNIGSINMATANAGRSAVSVINLTGGITTLGGNIVRSGGAGSENASINLDGGTLDMSGNNIGAASATLTFNAESGILKNLAQLNGGGVLTKTTGGTLTLEGTNTYTGGTAINDGILRVNSTGGNSLGTTGTISFGGGTLQHTANDTTDYSARFSTAGSQAVSIDTNGQDVTYATALSSTAGSLSKSGGGTLLLSNVATYSGATEVTGGTLEVRGLTSTSGVTLNTTGTTLAGSGSIAGSTILGSGTILAPGEGNTGTSNKTLTFTAATTSISAANDAQIQLGVTTADSIDGSFASWFHTNGGTAEDYLATLTNGIADTTWNSTPAGDHDFISAAGTIVLGSSATADKRIAVSLNSVTGLTYGSIFNLLDWSTLGTKDGTSLSTMSGAGGFNIADNLLLQALSDGLAWDTSVFNSHGILVVVPEPSRTLFLMLGLLGLMLRRRRR